MTKKRQQKKNSNKPNQEQDVQKLVEVVNELSTKVNQIDSKIPEPEEQFPWEETSGNLKSKGVKKLKKLKGTLFWHPIIFGLCFTAMLIFFFNVLIFFNDALELIIPSDEPSQEVVLLEETVESLERDKEFLQSSMKDMRTLEDENSALEIENESLKQELDSAKQKIAELEKEQSSK